MSICTYKFNTADGEQTIVGMSAFKAYLAANGVESIIPGLMKAVNNVDGDMQTEDAPSEPYFKEAKALLEAQKKATGNAAAESKVRKQLRDLAGKVQADSKTALALDIAATRLGMGEGKLKGLEYATPVAKYNGQDEWTVIGRNKDGKLIVADKRGVRSYVENGIRVTESVSMRPVRGGGMEISTEHKGEFLSVEESQPAASPAQATLNKLLDLNGRMLLNDLDAATHEVDVGFLKSLHDQLRALDAATTDNKTRKIDRIGYVLQAIQAKETGKGGLGSKKSNTDGQNDELDAEMRSYEAKANPTYSGEPAKPTAKAEATAKPDALTDKEKAAKAKMFGALGKLAALAGKNTRMNWTPEEEQQILPIVIELFDGAMELGAVTFQKAVRYVREFIAGGIDQETADAIPFETLQGAYIATSGRHKDKAVTPKREVATFDSLEELENSIEEVDTDTNSAENEPKETLLGANDDTRRNATNDSEPLDQTLPGASAEDGTGGNAETGTGVRETDTQGNGRSQGSGSGRGNRLDGSKKPVLPGSSAEIRPLADGPVGKTEDRPQQLTGENPGNFAITDEFRLGQGTDGDKISGNLEAIRTLRKIQQENRYPTKDEQTIMARYVGWGGLKTVFDPKKENATDQYGKAQRELKTLLSADEYRAANGSIRNAHYTAEGIVDGMWRVMRFMGFKGGRALEPTVGIGNFIGRMPADMAASTEWHASELDTTTGQLAAMLYPEANILASTGFQDAPFADGAFDISVGNPPFGAQTILDKSPNRKHLNGQKIHNYIIAKAGMHLRPGGVMSMVVTHRFLDTANPEARDVLAKDFRFLGAFRLPNDAFKKNAGTDVVTDVIFLQKLGADEKRERDASWLDVNGSIEVDGQAIRVNRYYQDNPSHILGRSAMDGSMQRSSDGEYTVHSDGRDIGKAIDALMQGGFSHMAGVLEQSNSSKALAPAMLTQSNLPIGGVMVNDEGKIVRREMNDDQGNAVVQEITPDTLWKDQAMEWQALRNAVLDVKNAAQAGKVTEDDANEVLALSRFLFKADGSQQGKPSKAVEAVYKLVEDLARPDSFKWSHGDSLLLITGALSRKQLGEEGYQALKGMLDLRNRTLRLVMAEQSNDSQMEFYRKDLNQAYDAFVKANGFLSDPKNANLLEGDIGAEAGIEANFIPAVSAAVAKSSGTPQRPASAKKSDIMNQRVNFPYKEISHADSPADALFASISEHGKVDIPYMAKITNQSAQSVIEALTKGDNPQLFRDPETGEYQEAERYLSGNVKHKLQLALERGLESNIKALEKSLPADKTQEQVKPNIRGMWMPPEIFTEFLQAIGYTDAKISVIASQGILQASGDALAMTDFGIQFRHGKRTPMDMFNSQASGKPIIITVTSNGSTYKDEQGTKEVNALAERMGKVFQEWAYADDGRVKRIVAAFNQNMNTHTPRTFDGMKYLKPVGASPSVVLRRTQMDGAWRMMQEKTMLADHVVGAGKTYTLITGIMERRRMGLSRKPMVVVPNHLVTQWARDFYKLYPGAKVLAASPADFAKKNRRRLLARIATGDYDAVIVGHTSIGFMETPTDDLKAIVDEKLAGLKEALAEARKSNESKRTLGQIEDRIDRYEARLKDLAARTTDDIGIDFKALGIDHLSVDEAHEFKNLEYSTSGDRVVGMNDPNGSKKAFDLYSKVRGLLSRGGSVTFATGTPVSNSLVEIYTMMSYLAHDELVLRGQEHFDSWSGAYAATETRLEYTATQKLKPRRVLAGLNNLSALRQLYEQFADIITMTDLKRIYTEEMEQKNKKDGTDLRTDFPVPKVMGGKRQLIALDITPAQKEYMDYLVARMAQIERKKSDREYLRIDNALNVLTDARKMSLDIRIVDPTAPRDENGKVATAAKNIKATYDLWNADRGTQLVFCDLSTPAKTAAKDARSIISATIEKLFGKDLAKQAKKQLDGMTFEKQWSYLEEKAEQITEDPATSEEKRDAIAEYMSKVEDPQATMNVADIGFSVYDDLKTVLMESGIPESEIAFIHDYNTPEQKDKLFDRVNNGYVRVLLGSSMKMGAGMNVQERLVALHHMDAPWRPSDVEQREGRIIRQKNSLYLRDPDGFEVEIKAYSTNQTSDTVMWQILQRKAGAIEQFREGGLDSVQEEGGDSNQYAEFMATSTGNPVFRQKLEAERKLTEIESEIGGALIVRSNAQSFMESYARRRAHAANRQEAWQSFDASSASYGGESGTKTDFDAAMKLANDDYLAKYAIWTQKNAAADLEIAKWEVLPEDTRGDKPSKPYMPSQPDLFTKSVQKASGYARAMGMALTEAKIGKSTKITMSSGSILVSGQEWKGGPYWNLYAQNKGEQLELDGSGAQTAGASTRLIHALTPFAISNKLKGAAKSYAYDIAQLDKGKIDADKNAVIAVDTSGRDAAQADLRWYTAQVAFAEVEADIARGASKNRYIERDKRRNIGQTAAVVTEEKKTHVIDGVSYTTTGIKAVAGWQDVIQATRDRDGVPTILTKTDKEGEFRATVQPKHLQKPKKETSTATKALPPLQFERMPPAVAMFSRSASGDTSPEQNALKALSENDELFALPKSDGDTLEGIAADTDPDITVKKLNHPGLVSTYILTLPNGGRARLMVRKVNQYGPQSYGTNASEDGETNVPILERPGNNAEAVPDDVEDVYIDVSALKEGKDGGKIYNIAATYAHNTGRILIGDPGGLSDIAMRRRTEHMLSSALKFGTTQHLAPHPRQVDGARGIGVPPLRWTYGDDLGNIKSLIQTSLDSLDHAGAQLLTFDLQTGTFRDSAGGVLDERTIRSVVESGRRPASRAGVATYKRSAVLRALVREEGAKSGAGGPGAGVLAQLVAVGRQFPAASQKIFYSRGANTSGLTAPQISGIVDAVKSRWSNAPDVVVVGSMDDPAIPQAVRDEDADQQSKGATGEPEGFYYGGKVYVVASTMSNPGDVIRVLFHEALGHAGLRGVFGQGMNQILNQVILGRRVEVEAKARQYGLDITKKEDMQQAAEEVLAEMAQTRPDLGFVQRAIALIKSWLREHVAAFRNLELTNDEIIVKFILPARRFVEGGPGNTESNAATLFQRSADQIDTESFKAWYGNWQNAANGTQGYDDRGRSTDVNSVQQSAGLGTDSVVGDRVGSITFPGASGPVGENGKPVVFFHGTRDSIDAFDVDHPNRKDKGWLGRGVYVASDRLDAETYSRMKRGSGSPNVMALYVSVKKPFIADISVKARLKDKSQAYIDAYTSNLKSQGYDGVAMPFEDGHIELVAFEPTQVKSATDNNGNFDGTNPNIRFSRSPVAAARDTLAAARELNLAAGYKLGDLFKFAAKTSWWDRTVGTQFNLAQRNKEYRRVYDGVQTFLSDVSTFASRAADLAPNMLPKLDTLADLRKKALSQADVAAVSAPIFQGTLNYTRDENGEPVESEDVSTAGVVWTVKELRDMFNLTGERQADGSYSGQIGLYHEFRKATNQSLTTLAISDIIRFGGQTLEPIGSILMDSSTVAEAQKTAQDYLNTLADADLQSAESIDQLYEGINTRAKQAKHLMDRGYAPLSRFGKYAVYVEGQDGEQLYFGMYETQREANRAERALAAEFPEAQISNSVMSQEQNKLFQGVTPETLALFGEAIGMDANDPQSALYQQYLKLVTNSRSSMKRLIKRKGVSGYSEDATRVLAGFVTSNARKTSSNLNMGVIGRATNEIKAGDVKDQAIKLKNYVENPQEEAQALKALMFTQYIGGSVASALINMTQPLTMTMPYLSQYIGVKAAPAAMVDAFRMAATDLKSDPDLAKAMKRAEEDGTVSPQEIHQLQAQAGGRGSLQSSDGTKIGNAMATASNGFAKFQLVWGKMFSAAEQFNRRVTFIAAYKMARDQNMKDPFAFAEHAINETQGVYNKGNRPNWARGAIGGTLFTFKQYSISYVEFLTRMYGNGPAGKRAVGLALAVLFLTAGLGGMPGADDLDDILDGIMQRLGYNFSSKQKKKEFFANLLGSPAAAEFMLRGLSGLPGVPLDVSGRMGLGNLIPATGIFTKKADHSSDLMEIAGPAGDLAKRAGAFSGHILDGNLKAAVKDIAPTAGQNIIKGIDMLTMGMYRDSKGNKVIVTDPLDAVIKMVGFQPNDVARVQQGDRTVYNMIALTKLVESEISDQMAQGRFERNQSKIENARAQLQAWNSRNPESRIVISEAQINRRVQNMNRTKAQRLVMTAPKEIRATVQNGLTQV